MLTSECYVKTKMNKQETLSAIDISVQNQKQTVWQYNEKHIENT